MGLNKEILDNAKKYLNTNNINIEELLKKIHDDKIIIENEKENILKNSKQLEDLRKQLEQDKEKSKEKETKILEQAKLEARQILLSAKEQVSLALSELNDAKSLNKKRNDINEHIKELNSNITTYSIKDSSDALNKDDIKIDMTVFVPNFNKNGTVLSLPNNSNEVIVQIGNIKVNLNINTLAKPTKIENTSKIKTDISKSKTISTELNIIGLNVDEAIPIVDKYLDDAYISSLTSVRIVHGKGTGALRKGIQAFLKTHHHVKDFRIGTFGEGEMGVTVVSLKK